MVRIVEQDHLTEADETRLLAPLDQHAAGFGVKFSPESLILTLRQDGSDSPVMGGLVGATNWEWLHIRILAVPAERRGQGIGRELMRLAEDIARDRGCRAAWVDTYSFQAPGFYERLGYKQFGTLPDYPPGHSRLFYWKPLAT